MHRHFLPCLFAIAMLFPWTAAAEIQLPDMGAGSNIISPQEEQRLGRDILRELRRAGKIVDDPGLNNYLNALGNRLAVASGNAGELDFFLVNDPTINAFALPGGYIGVNAGLIQATQRESELASVLAHEIAHVTQRHIARSLESMNNSSLPLTAALVAAVILGSQNPELGQAAIAGALASNAQARLDFSRLHEQEADRIGMQFLQDAGFDPEGMASFFERLYRETRYSGGEASELEFLRTHPVTISRISDARGRAQSLRSEERPQPDAASFDFIRAEMRARLAPDPHIALRQFAAELEAGNRLDRSAARFGYAIALLRSGQSGEALKQLKKVDAPRDVVRRVTRARAEVEIAVGTPAAALATLRHGLEQFPGDAALTLELAELLIKSARFNEAATLLREFVRDHEGWPQAHQLLSRAENGSGRPGAGRLALAEYYVLVDEPTRAIEQLEMARRDASVDFYDLARIEARLGELKSIYTPQPKTENQPDTL